MTKNLENNNNDSVSKLGIDGALHNKNISSISYRSLITIVISILVGVIVTLLLINVSKVNPETFSTEGLITFIVGIAISAASTVLAIEAIILGRFSEQAIIKRSDESIKFQNEVFMKTIEALGRIESSTGVTEKRIEDIISGRASSITDRIYKNIVDDKSERKINLKELEKGIRDSLMAELKTPPNKEDEIKRHKAIIARQDANKRYEEFLNNILIGVSNFPKVFAKKIGSGSFKSSGDGLVDGIFSINEKRFAVSMLSASFVNPTINDSYHKELSEYLLKLSIEIQTENFSKIFITIDGDITSGCGTEVAFSDFRRISKTEISEKIFVIGGNEETILNKIKEIIITSE